MTDTTMITMAAERARVLREKAYPAIRDRRDELQMTSALWASFYEELRPYVQSTRQSDLIVREMDELLEQTRGR